MSILGYTKPRGARGIQIGPRIRVGGTLGKIGQNLKIGAGKVLSNPAVDFGIGLIPGVGPGVAAAANAAGHVLDTSGGGINSVGDVLNVGKDAALAYGAGLGGNVVRDAAGKIIGGAGIGDVLKGLPSSIGTAIKGIPGVSSVESMLGLGDGSGGAGGAGGGMNWGQLGLLGLGGAQLANAINLGKKSSDYANQAIGGLQGNYDDRSRLRVAGLEGMLNPRTPDLSGLMATSGPYAAGMPRPAPLQQYTGMETVPSRTGTVSGK